MNSSQFALSVDQLLDLLAVFEQIPQAVLARLLDRQSEEVDWQALASRPEIIRHGDELSMVPSIAAKRLAQLEKESKSRFQQLHHEALTLLVAELEAGKATVGSILLAVFRRLADHLLADRAGGFEELVVSARKWPCQSQDFQQWLDYYVGVSQLEQDAFEEALASFDRLLAQPSLADKLHGRLLNSRANVYRVKGRHEDALNGYRSSLSIWERLSDAQNAGKALLNMGASAYYLQNYAKAEPWLAQAAAIFTEEQMPVLYGAAENGLGLVYRDQGRWADAMRHFQIFIKESTTRGSSDSVGIGLLNVGEVQLFQGHLEEAIQTLQQALIQMERRLFVIDVHLHLGLAHWGLGQTAPAEDAFAAAARLAHELDRKEVIPHVAYWQGVVAESIGDFATAEARYQEAIAIIEESRHPLTEEGLKISLLGRWQQIYEALVLLYCKTNRTEDAFQWAERSRARAFAELLTSSTLTANNTREAHNESAVTVSMEGLQACLPLDSAVLCYFTTGVLASDIPMLSAIPADNPLRQRLLIEPNTLCFVITREKYFAHQCPIDPNLFTMVSPRGYDPNRWLEPAVIEHLSTTLLPITEMLKQQRLYIIPHGPLHLVPFAALYRWPEKFCPLFSEYSEQVEQEPGQDFSGEVYHENGQHGAVVSRPIQPMTTVPNATVLAHRLQSNRDAKTNSRCYHSALTVGYNGDVGGKMLKYTEPEVNAVAGLLGGDAIVGKEPKKGRLRSCAASKKWLHIACHGWFNHDEPLSSYLETGIGERLMAKDVLETWSLDAELVTLSACQTGVSRVLRGDEPMGLVRGFLAAGAKAVLVTKWPVEDLPTCLLMLRFYQLLAVSSTVDLSYTLLTAQHWLQTLTLQDAQIFLAQFGIKPAEDDLSIEATGESLPFSHPKHWAAFTLVIGK
ncbi:MAG: CHAT domain-containing tetratricopeptide repeat protein [Chloroflexota bacterium]